MSLLLEEVAQVSGGLQLILPKEKRCRLSVNQETLFPLVFSSIFLLLPPHSSSIPPSPPHPPCLSPLWCSHLLFLSSPSSCRQHVEALPWQRWEVTCAVDRQCDGREGWEEYKEEPHRALCSRSLPLRRTEQHLVPPPRCRCSSRLLLFSSAELHHSYVGFSQFFQWMRWE